MFFLEWDEVMFFLLQYLQIDRLICFKGFFWVFKVREKDIEMFFEFSCSKFIGYILGSDMNIVVGLFRLIYESIKILKQYKYMLIVEVQVQMEEEYFCFFFLGGEEEVE